LAISTLASTLPSRAVLGAGTVTTPARARDAVEAGARFLVSPGTTDALAVAMKATGAACMMGALTPGEIMRVLDLGTDVVKLFPASIGGPSYLRALRGPFLTTAFMPTGGVNPDNIAQWHEPGWPQSVPEVISAPGQRWQRETGRRSPSGRASTHELGRRPEMGTPEQTRTRMGFVGVTTRSSLIMRIFPRWAEELGLPARWLEGHDVELDAPRETYRALVRSMRDDPHYLGALVTTHKMSVYEAAADLFDEIDHFGRLCGEVSSISKRDGRLVGHAKDPISADLAMREFIPDRHFADSQKQVLCLGSGGAATAITWCLAGREHPPARIICTDVNQDRLDHIALTHREGGLDPRLFSYEFVSGPADELLAPLPRGSLVINATGLGKDRAGSPLSDRVRYPEGAFVWELNYRGSLEMLANARAQEHSRDLTVVDGWRYFIHGWTQVIAEVFDVDMTPARVEQLSQIAVELT